MKTKFTALVTIFQGKKINVQPLADIYSEVQVEIESDTDAYSSMKDNLDQNFTGPVSIKNTCLEKMAQNKSIILSGEAKDLCFKVGEFEVKLDTQEVDWS